MVCDVCNGFGHVTTDAQLSLKPGPLKMICPTSVKLNAVLYHCSKRGEWINKQNEVAEERDKFRANDKIIMLGFVSDVKLHSKRTRA